MLTPSIPTALPPLRTCCHACHTCSFSMGCVFASVRPLLLSRGGVPNSGCFVASFAPRSLQPPSSLVRRHLTSCPASNGLASWELHLCAPLLIGCMISLVPCKSLAGSPATYMPDSGRATMSSLAIPVLVPQALTIPRFSNRYVFLDTSSVVHLRSALRASPETGPRPFSLYRSTPGPREPSTGGWFDESSLVKFSSVGLPPSSTQLRIGYRMLFLLSILESHVRQPIAANCHIARLLGQRPGHGRPGRFLLAFCIFLMSEFGGEFIPSFPLSQFIHALDNVSAC